MSEGLAMDNAAEVCANCGVERQGDYCHGCGQRFVAGRLSLKTLWHEVMAPVLNFERGIPRTLRDSLLTPGVVIRRYLDGQRRRYANPLSYLLAGVAIALLVSSLAHNNEDLNRLLRQDSGETLSRLFTAEQVDRFIELQVSVSRSTSIFMLFLCLPFAALLRLFIRGGAITFAEAVIFALFAFGTAYFLSLPTTLVYLFSGNFHLEVGLTLLILVGLIMLCAWQFFGHSLWAAIKAASAFAISYFLFSTILGLSLLAYVALGGP